MIDFKDMLHAEPDFDILIVMLNAIYYPKEFYILSVLCSYDLFYADMLIETSPAYLCLELTIYSTSALHKRSVYSLFKHLH